jgi:hypothetical protein
MINPTTRLYPPVKPVASLRSPSFEYFVLETRGFGDKITKKRHCKNYNAFYVMFK